MACKIKSIFFHQIFDPSSELIVHWNTFIFVVGLINFYLDPMPKFLPTLDSNTVLNLDLQLGLFLVALRTFGDLIMICNILVKFRTAFEAPGSRVFKRRRMIEDPSAIAIKYLKSDFIIDLLATLPLPQAYLCHRIRASKARAEITTSDIIIFYGITSIIFWFQLLPRLYFLVRLRAAITKTTGILIKSAMSGAFYNLLSFMNLSNIVGSIYYQSHIYWVLRCRMIVRRKGLQSNMLGWDQLLSNCTESPEMEQGMISSSLTNKIGTRNFVQKYMFCFSWGLKSLRVNKILVLLPSYFSSLGQNFTTGFSTLETSLSICITLLGLIFFADLVTRMQAGIQSMEEREEQQRARQREIKEWMQYHQLPLHLKQRIDLAIQSEWTESIDNETMLYSLPTDLRSEIRKYLYMDPICKLTTFANMGTPLVEAICQHLKTFSSKESTYIVYEGDIVKQMLIIYSGRLQLSFTDRGNSSLSVLGPGESCGQELVTWASQPTTSMDNLPPSTWTIKCLTDVEAFVLHAYDMKILATQFAHNQEFQRAFKQHYP